MAACLGTLTRYDGWFLLPFVAACFLFAAVAASSSGAHTITSTGIETTALDASGSRSEGASVLSVRESARTSASRSPATPSVFSVRDAARTARSTTSALIGRFLPALLFCLLAGAGPLYWMVHNWYETGDALDFYRGPYSAFAIQGSAPYPGSGDWHMAWYYYRQAVELCAGPALALMALAGAAGGIPQARLLAAGPAGAAGSLFHLEHAFRRRPHLHAPPLAVLLLQHPLRPGRAAAAGTRRSSALVMASPAARASERIAILLIGGADRSRGLLHPGHEHWITWAESRANSEGRRAWIVRGRRLPRSPLRARFRYHLIVGDDFFGIYRDMGIPLRETFTDLQRPAVAWRRWSGPICSSGRSGPWSKAAIPSMPPSAGQPVWHSLPLELTLQKGRAGDRNLPAHQEASHGTA